MKPYRNRGAAWGLALGLALAGSAGARQSFQATNNIAAGVACVGYATNAVGTNGCGLATGTAVSVENYEQAGFYLTALPVGMTNTSTLTLILLRSWAAYPPRTCADTNGWTTNTDWESPSGGIVLTVSIPSQTNVFAWYTNLPTWQVGAARWLGLYAVTNSLPGSSLTNFNAGLARKLVPIRFP